MGLISEIIMCIALLVVASALLSSCEKSRQWADYAEANGCVEVDRKQELVNTFVLSGSTAVPQVIAVNKIKYRCRNGAEVWR